MGLYAALTDLLRQVANVLQPAHGGTGSTHGEQRTVVRAVNSTGSSLPLYTLVQPTFGANDLRVAAVASANSKTVLGAVVGYYAGDGQLVEAAAPDGYEVAVQTAGVVRVLIESTVTRADYAFSAATDGTMVSSSTAGVGAFGVVIDSADTSDGHTYARVFMPITAFGASSGGVTGFGTPALTLDTSNAAGSASTAIRTDATIALFDTTAASTQAPGDTATTGSDGNAARRDHKHGWPSFGTGSTNIAQGDHTHGGAGAGVWDGVITKSADEDVTSSTTLQDDNELVTPTLTNNAVYQFEAWIIMACPGAGGAPDIKFSFGEDNTFRGYLMRLAGNAGTGAAEVTPGSVQSNQALTAQTGTTPFVIYVVGSWVSGGGTFKLQWAQNGSNVNPVRVYAGSTLKYKRLV